jgi:hypothetical protein
MKPSGMHKNLQTALEEAYAQVCTGVYYVFGDLHIGNRQSRWREVIQILEQLEDLGALIFAGDTLELRYMHEQRHWIEPSEEQQTRPEKTQEVTVWNEFQEFTDQLDQLGLLDRTVLLRGNHDSTIDIQFSLQGYQIQDYAYFWGGNQYALIIHGQGIGYESAMKWATREQRDTTEALRRVKTRLTASRNPSYPVLRKVDWLIVAHFATAVLDMTGRVCGLSPFTHDLLDGRRGAFARIAPAEENSERFIELWKYSQLL